MQIADQQDNKKIRNRVEAFAGKPRSYKNDANTAPAGARLAREEALTAAAELSRCTLAHPRHPLVR
jgi:hypothetical protein